jgi:hypothetical protein
MARLIIVALSLAALGGCQALGIGVGPTAPVAYPAGCSAFGFSQRRCDAIVREALGQAQLARDAVTAIELLPPPTLPPGVMSGGGDAVAIVRLHTAAGTTDQTVGCWGVGGNYRAVCTENPRLQLSMPVDGYRDIPCSGDPPAGCATAVPPPDPVALKGWRPLSVPSRDIPIARIGRYEIEVGHAGLPNGWLSDARFKVASDQPTDFTVRGPIALVVRGPDGAPITNVYQQGWREGVEDVTAVVVFDVEWYEPGAVLGVRDLVVR